MKPYGQGDKIAYFWSKVDHHIREGNKTLKNWWEGEVKIVKAKARQDGKQIIRKEIDEYSIHSNESPMR